MELLDGPDSRGLEDRAVGPLRVPHHLDHLAFAPGDFPQERRQFLRLLALEAALRRLDVAQQGHAGGIQVGEQSEQPLPEVVVLARGDGVRALPPARPQAQEQVGEHQRAVAGKPDRAAGIEVDVVGKSGLHEVSAGAAPSPLDHARRWSGRPADGPDG